MSAKFGGPLFLLLCTVLSLSGCEGTTQYARHQRAFAPMIRAVAEQYRDKKHASEFWQPEAEVIPTSDEVPDIPRPR